ncbi:MAG: hypothetical protein ACK5U4_07485 [Rhodospirillales bacterium]|jgi:hypothetical protein|nr:hypothetical protein [Magnetospirillum sp.]
MTDTTPDAPDPLKLGDPPELPKDIPPPLEASKSTHFIFDHKLFAIPDCFLGKDPNTDDPGLSLPLGEVRAFLPLGPLMKMFKDLSADDIKLLNLAINGLSHVREIRPGDSIPAEILDGSASWSVGPEHLDRARGMMLASLVTIDKMPPPQDAGKAGATLLERDPKFVARRDAAFDIMAERFGALGERKHLQGVMDRLARELSYIEGLRDRYTLVGKIAERITSSARVYKNSGTLSEEIYRVRLLMKAPVDAFNMSFENVDGQCAEIANVLRKTDEMVSFVRKNRDELHQRLMIWDRLVEQWRDEDAQKRSKRLETLLLLTYRFVARNFPANQEWTLSH